MGLYIQSLENIPVGAKRDYFIYLLDYGWDEPLGEALMKNYEKMATLAAENKAVVIRGTHRVHFEDEVLSWHNINGENAEDILPAILITNKHPLEFKVSFEMHKKNTPDKDLKMILVPLKKLCKTTTEVVSLIEKIFNDIIDGKDLNDFRIGKEMNKGVGRAIVDAIILEPKIAGVGFSFNKMINYLRTR
jgi:hypothetical protein